MIPVNIALYFNNNINKQLIELSKNYCSKNNNIIFTQKCLPHITLLQFFCCKRDVYKINNLLLNFNNLENKLNDQTIFNLRRQKNNKYIIDNLVTNNGFNKQYLDLRNELLLVLKEFIKIPDEKKIKMNLNINMIIYYN